jgi:hypothetical protein
MENEPIIDNRDFLVTETTIDPKLPPEQVLSFLRGRKTTGKVTLEYDLSQGGIQKVTVIERTRAKEGQRNGIRAALGIE